MENLSPLSPTPPRGPLPQTPQGELAGKKVGTAKNESAQKTADVYRKQPPPPKSPRPLPSPKASASSPPKKPLPQLHQEKKEPTSKPAPTPPPRPQAKPTQFQKPKIEAPSSQQPKTKEKEESLSLKNRFLNLLGHHVVKKGEEARGLKRNIENLVNDLQNYMKKASEKMRGKLTFNVKGFKEVKTSIMTQTKILIGVIRSQFERVQQNISEIATKDQQKVNDTFQKYKAARQELQGKLDSLKKELGSKQNGVSKAQENSPEKIEAQKVLAVDQGNLMLELENINKLERELINSIKSLKIPFTSKEEIVAVLEKKYPDFANDVKKSFEQNNNQRSEILKLISKNGQILSKSLTKPVESELKSLATNKQKIEHPFAEFIRNEGEFKNNLEDLKAYKLELDALIEDEKKLEKLGIKDLNLEDVKQLKETLAKYIFILNSITIFYKKIQKIGEDKEKLTKIPLFAFTYLGTDFTPMFNVVSIHTEFLKILKKGGISELCRAIRDKEIESKLKYELNNPKLGINDIASSAFQRVGRYPMTLTEMKKGIPEDKTNLNMLVGQCKTYAEGVASVVNNW